MTRRDLIRELIAGCADGQVVTVRVDWLRELLGGDAPMESGCPTKDLDVDDLAEHYGRSTKTMAAWCREGVFPQAYLTPAGWRVPRGSLRLVAVRRKKQPQGNAGPRATSAAKHLAVEPGV